MLSRLGRPGIAPKDIVRRMQEIMAHTDVSILKTGEGLSRALAEVEEVRDNVLPDMSASEPHYLLKAMEARSMTMLTEMYLRASLARRESRCGHYRQDHPERNRDICWIDIENAGGAIRTRQERLPLERYPVTPTRFYMDDFNYPK